MNPVAVERDPDTTGAQHDALESLAWRHDSLQVDYVGGGLLKVALRDRRPDGVMETRDVLTIDRAGGCRFVGY